MAQKDKARTQQALEEEFYLELKEGVLDPLDVLDNGDCLRGRGRYADTQRHFRAVLLGTDPRQHQYHCDRAGLV